MPSLALRHLLPIALILPVSVLAQQYRLRGVVVDASSGETLIGANVVIKGTTTGATTDVDGRFEIGVNELPPYTLVISFIGYQDQEVLVKSLDQELKFKLSADQVLLQEAEVVGSRISEKQKQAPLTVESMDVIAIREAPSGDFYESLGTLKGVDMTAASFGFKVINTRGFNSTSPVRSLQLIDGVDNQSPGLNFSLGNFLGASDLDVMKVDVIAGASTAYYGPGAFNGVINMTTKSPWLFPGLSVSMKGGERDLLEAAVRWAQVINNGAGQPRFAYKLNFFGLRAEDWYAEDYSATSNSPTSVDNPGRYDAVNIYGDENTTVNNDFSKTQQSRREHPGLGLFLRPGYKETDLVDYGTRNLKAGVSLHYRLKQGTDSIAPMDLSTTHNFSTGSTVYQGDNRYRLKNIRFFQHQIGIGREGTWFTRAYLTHEDAGDTYDIYTTGIRLQEASGTTKEWNTKYYLLWDNWIEPMLNADEPGYYTPSEAVGQGITTADAYDAYLTQFIADHHDLFVQYHQIVADSVNSLNTTLLDPAYIVDTDRFNEKLDEIKRTRFTDGGSLFYDKSALFHAMGEYRFKPAWAEIAVGGSYREYHPNTAGTIFRDTGDVKIINREFGGYVGLERSFMDRRLKATATLRMDKNENFKYLFSPAASLVFNPTQDHTIRLSFSSAVRNPTLADQYLYYNVGRAILLGNIDGQFEEGRDSLITLDSFDAYRNSPNLQAGLSELEYFNVDRVRPEQVRTIEAGYRGTIGKWMYIDLGAYHSWYTDFIGYLIGISTTFDASAFPRGLQVYRVATNSTEQVRTEGANIGVNFYSKKFTYTVNYSWNKLVAGANDPIIPAFNTPENKFNLGITGHDLRIPFTTRQDLGFGVNYKYIEGFTFEGSPQFTGPIPSYDLVDVQVNVRFPKNDLTVKLGCSDLFGIVPLFDPDVPGDEKPDRMWNNDVRMVYGGPLVGRLAYLQLIYELDMR